METQPAVLKTWERRMNKAKKGHRPSLKNWSRDGFATRRKDEFYALRTISQQTRSIPRISAKDYTLDDFRRDFEVPYKPCIITDVPAVQSWKATSQWAPGILRNNFKNRMFKCGEDDDGYKIKTKLKHFLSYMKYNQDDSPLYIFDGNFDEDNVSNSLLNDYTVPKFFPDDLFSLVGEKRRPPYRWFLVGPERSGTTVHTDPLGTSAWNTVIMGRKRWVLFPPCTAKAIAKGLDVKLKGEDDEAINYFVDMLPRIRNTNTDQSIEIYEFIQEPGETVFVPGGWWHGVLNLDDTIAITQNYASPVNFDKVWIATRKGRKKMSIKWLKRLRECYPILADRAEELNRRDSWDMIEYVKQSKASKKTKNREKAEKNISDDSRKRKRDDTTNESGCSVLNSIDSREPQCTAESTSKKKKTCLT